VPPMTTAATAAINFFFILTLSSGINIGCK
jgi:hypothetical protein